MVIAQRKIKVFFETVPVAVTATAVTLAGTGPHGGRRSVAAEAMFVLIGGVPAWDLLTRAGIRRPASRRKDVPALGAPEREPSST
jgi:thioredoxin reductase